MVVFERGNWSGRAYFNGDRLNGCLAFSNLATRGYFGEKINSNMQLGLALSADGVWNAAFRKAVGKFQRGRHYTMTLVVDGWEVHKGTTSIDQGGIAYLRPPLSPEAIRALSRGELLTVKTNRGSQTYSLQGSADAIELTAKCVSELSRPVAAELPRQAQPAPIPHPTRGDEEVQRIIDDFARSKPDFRKLSNLILELLPSVNRTYPDYPPQRRLEIAYAQAQKIDRERSKPAEKQIATGTAFFISEHGHILTNAHVVEGCKNAVAIQPGGASEPAHVIARDVANDLALLRTNLRSNKVAAMRTSVRTGEAVATYGFPRLGMLPTTGNFTTGNVTATAGLLDNSSMLQVSVPIQGGNSGGPLVDQAGNVVGVIVAKLRTIELGDIPQNVNFAIKASVARTFLEAHGVTVSASEAPPAQKLAPEDLAEATRKFTVIILCQ